MKIFATGEQNRLDELRRKIGAGHDVVFEANLDEHLFSGGSLMNFDLIFDLNLDDDPDRLQHYQSLDGKMIIGSTVKKSLAQIAANVRSYLKERTIGMNTLPTFIDRPKAEVSFLHKGDQQHFQKIAGDLGWEFLEVEDRVGMVTPRIVTMIINEACFTLQEGTASMEDIDKGMRLGTNYPYGPFEWCDRIGIRDVYETLEAIWSDTHDERYKICPLLKTRYLKRELFYST